MIRTALILGILIFQSSLLAQTYKSGDIDGETWTADNSPYIIIDNIKVIDLIIEPGVLIQFDDNHKFEVDGVLQSEGFHSDSIYFQPHPDNTAGWEGVKFKNSSTSSSLKYCRIEGSNKNGIDIDQVQPEISNCRIVGSKENGIFLKGTSLQLQHCIIKKNGQNGIETDDSQVTVLNSIIAQNSGSGILSTNNNDIINVVNVVIAYNMDRGIDCPGGDLSVNNSIIYYNNIQIDINDGITNVTYSDVQGEPVFPGVGNINTSPDFLETRFYTLAPQSECIDAGDPNFSYTDWFFPPSMGTSRNDMGAYGGPQAFGWYPPLYIKPQEYDFSSVTQDSSKTTILNVLNYRDESLTVDDISFEGADNYVFNHNPDSFSVEIRDSVELAITFTPDDERIYASDLILQIQSHGTVSIPMTGEGVLPHINIPSSDLNFGPVQIGEQRELYIHITNSGGDSLFVQIASPTTANFVLDKTQLVINPDFSSDSLRVSFTPDSMVDYQDSLLILSNDRDRPEIKISLTGRGLGSRIVIDRQNINFDSVDVLSSSETYLDIQNNGNDTLRINNLSFDPVDTDFSLQGAPFAFPLKIAPDSLLTLSIRFNPQDRGPASAQLSISSNDPYQNLITINLSGVGIAPQLVTSSSQMNFGSVLLTADSTINLTVFNLGNDILQIDSLLFSPSNNVFTLADTMQSYPITINPESNAALPIRFAPLERGAANAQLTLLSNDPFHDTVAVQLVGEGIAAGINVSAYNLDFGYVSIDSALTQTIRVLNSGDIALTIDSVSINSAHPVFIVRDSAIVYPYSINTNDSLVLPITFMPASTDSFDASLHIYSDDPFQKDVSVQLRGQGVDNSPKPSILLSTETLEYSDVDTNTYAQESLTIYNTGNAILRIPEDSIYIVGASQGSFSLTNVTDDIAIDPVDSLIITIRFEPKEIGLHIDTLQIKSNDPLNPGLIVGLSGTGVASGLLPEIYVSTDVIEFSDVDTSTYSQKAFYIYNYGDVNLLIPEDSLIIANSASGAFTLVDISGDISIDPLDSLDISVRFQPTQLGLNLDTLNINSNDPQNPTILIELSGTGVETGLIPEIFVSKNVLEFNQVDTTTYEEKIFYISNLGNQTLIVPKDSIYIEHPADQVFSITSPIDDIFIAPQDSEGVTIRFEPTAVGPFIADLWIMSNDPQTPSTSVTLSGTGISRGSALISIDQTNSTDPLINRQPATFSFQISSSASIDSAILYIRKGGINSYTKFSLQKQGGLSIWSADIDSSHITERGIEYYVSVNQGHTVTEFPENGDNQPNAVTVQIPYMAFPERTHALTYQMISLPFATPGQTLDDLFLDNLGPYNVNNYRIFECTNGANYTEISEMNKALPPGKSIWLITKNPTDLDIQNGESVLTDDDYRIQLREGWNMISSPFAFTAAWDGLSAGLALRHFDGSDWPFSIVMEPFKGYAVKAAKDTIISIRPVEIKLQKSFPKPDELEFQNNWRIQILAENDKAKDVYNYVGTSPLSTSGNDRNDFPEPPPIGEYLSLYLISESDDSKLSTDFREPGADGYIFNIELKSNLQTPKSVKVKPVNLPNDLDWAIVSPSTGINFGKEPIRTSSLEAKYRLLVGTAAFLNQTKSEFKSIPAEFLLAQNFPNPFNPTTMINYQLPVTSFIELTIYNALGQKVVTLISEVKEAGYHQVEWDAAGFASGIYYYRIQAGKYQNVKKMVLLR
jgi:hypothetical protein